MTHTAVDTNLDRLAAFPAALKQQLHGLSDAALRHQPAHEWSSIENVGHLIDIEATWMGRIRQMLSAENPALQAIDPDALVQRGQYQHKQADGLLRGFADMRAETVEFLRSLKPLHLERHGIHPARGAITVADAIEILANHDQLHSAQIAKTLDDYKA